MFLGISLILTQTSSFGMLGLVGKTYYSAVYSVVPIKSKHKAINNLHSSFQD